MPSPWNVDRSETARAVRRAVRFVANREGQRRDFAGGMEYPFLCHILPLGRIGSHGDIDRLARYRSDPGGLTPPGRTDTYTRFGAYSLEILSDPFASDFALTWFGFGGVELCTRPTRRGFGLVKMIQEVIPWLGETVCSMADPPICVVVTVSGRPHQTRLQAPPLDENARVLPVPEFGRVTLPPIVIHECAEFSHSWPLHAEWLLTRFAQAYGHPSFHPSEWHPPMPDQDGR